MALQQKHPRPETFGVWEAFSLHLVGEMGKIIAVSGRKAAEALMGQH